MEPSAIAKGLKFRLHRWHIRIWWGGFEYGNWYGGRVILFPWNKMGKDKYPYLEAIRDSSAKPQPPKEDA